MPLALYMLALAVFAQGTSEFMLSGLIPDIAHDLQVSIPAAGSLTSAFAAGMVIGAPLMAAVSLRWPRRRSLLIFLTVFLAVHVIGAITTEYEVLLATRVVAAVSSAGFLAVAIATATTMVGPNAKGRATGILLGGVTLACVAGVPAGALLGQAWGWRSAFWAVAIASVPAVLAIRWSIPAGRARTRHHGVRRELRSLRNPRLLVALLLGALVNGGTFCVFTYLAPMLTDVTGFAVAWLPALLALFGVGSFVGVTLGGRIADTHSNRLLLTVMLALLLGWLAFAALAVSASATIVLLFVQAVLSFAVGSTLITRVLYEAADAPTLAGGFATSAFNVGAAAGPWLGGIAITAQLGYVSPVWVSGGLVGAAVVVAVTATGIQRRRPAPGPKLRVN